MKKIALVFVAAVLVPSLLLAVLAVRSLRDQQLILERQQFLLYQSVADNLAKQAEDFLNEQQREFAQQVETLLGDRNPRVLVAQFDDKLRTNWSPAALGCVVTVQGELLSPPANSRPAAQIFWADFGKFLGNRESAEVYANIYGGNKALLNNGNLTVNYTESPNAAPVQQPAFANTQNVQMGAAPDNNFNGDNANRQNQMSKMAANNQRIISPQKQEWATQVQNATSKVSSSEAEFNQLVGDSTDGTVARFVDNKLNVLLWHRSPRDTNLIFAAQLSLAQLKQRLQPLVTKLEPALRADIAVALLDDSAKAVAVSQPGFVANWKHPFVATEIGEALPHWEMAVYLLNPAQLARSAQTLRLTLGLLIGVLLLAIGVGSWLIAADLHRQLTLARQKTDFVSNVSHELKTPLTSIRMFSELLAEGRVTEPEKRQTYLNIITAETSRLTRLINNVLDFSRMERGEKKYSFSSCDLAALVRETADTYRPHLESLGFQLKLEGPDAPIPVNGDRDALAQIIVNLVSNAEKYSNGAREIIVQVEPISDPLPHVEVRVLDHGPGVPRGCEEKIFEQFFRAHDSLASGIQGSGLGLTLARQIARAHGGDVVYRLREGGGSCFILRLPILPA